MRAVVLVGGEGTRLRPLTYTTPKPLLPIANVPFLERQLRWLAAHGVDEVVLSLGYLPDAFEARFPARRAGDVRLSYAVEDEPLGTAGAIRYAAEGIEERFVVCNGDVLTSLDLAAMVAFHDERGAEATIHLSRVDDPSAFGVVPTRDDGQVIAFVEKPDPGRAPSSWINAGTYVLEPAFLRRIPPRLNVSVERETFPRVLAQPGLLYGYRSDAYWLDIGTPEKYLEAHADLLAGRLGLPPADGAREVAAGVWVQGDVTIEREARLDAPVLIGDGARVERDARVARSVLGPGSCVESGGRVDGAALLRGACVRRGAGVLGSVLGEDAVLDGGAWITDATVVGAGAVVPVGTRISGGRVPPADARLRGSAP
jgi:NDP-sugar pyrophosphorylase family protein